MFFFHPFASMPTKSGGRKFYNKIVHRRRQSDRQVQNTDDDAIVKHFSLLVCFFPSQQERFISGRNRIVGKPIIDRCCSILFYGLAKRNIITLVFAMR